MMTLSSGVAVPRAAGEVGSPVAGVHVADREPVYPGPANANSLRHKPAPSGTCYGAVDLGMTFTVLMFGASNAPGELGISVAIPPIVLINQNKMSRVKIGLASIT
jgi:hypothetical protein